MNTTTPVQVPRLRHPLALEEFYHDYYVPRRPVVITTESLAQLGWQTHLWTNEYLSYKAGAQQVLVLRRDDASNFAPDSTRYTPMPFHQFLAQVMTPREGDRDIYLNLQHDNVIEPPLLQLVGDFNIPVYFKDLALRCVNLWMGNSGESITTPLHHDFNDNLYVVVEGRKHFTLFPPEQAVNLYPQGKLLEVEPNGYIRYENLDHRPHMSLLDPVNPDMGRFPLYATAAETRRECYLDKNEMLFLPTGWFHQVTSIGRHVAVSFFSVTPTTEQLQWLEDAIASRRERRGTGQA
ncbi:MAG: cupin-like domain-containing protein [Gammaproteobacteria bacterium]|nr:cupin-like domain-containing protein [Gammaproteobacteria bacterium]